MDSTTARTFVDHIWDHEIVPNLVDYIRIPNKSPAFDPDWQTHGHMDRAVEQFAAWARAKVSSIAGARVEVIRLERRTPVIFIDIPGQGAETVLLYGHLDKQPEMTGWADGLGPWIPKIREGRLYGRGGADDGYAMFGALAAILALRAQGTAHARCAILIEACEESGSYDLPFYVDHLAERLGSPSLVVCLDSGCANYDQLWLTTSLRGMVGGTLTVQVLEEGVHSGDASGVVASSFRILRSLLSRIEDEETGEILPHAFAAQIPAGRLDEAKIAAAALGAEVYKKFPFISGMRPVSEDPATLILNRTWRPALSITGLDGAPRILDAGNVLRPATSAKLSLRVPPTTDAAKAGRELKALLEAEPPYGAKVTFEVEKAGSGWDAPPLADWLRASVNKASQIAFGRAAAMMGEGGSIPFMGMLGEKYPKAQFMITGVLGPHSNAHGPNEFLHIAMGKGVTLAVAQVLADHCARAR
ncbi:MAG TPA: M20 family metallopeptidase [Dongiaceae bacterium]|nr:M20 family metallopeptidase [Dongiaceae bacterium]